MRTLEFNKIAAAILVANLVVLLSSMLANALYKPKLKPDNRGYQIEVSGDGKQNFDDIAHSDQQIDIKKLMASANAEKGKQLVKKCVSCHTFNDGGENKIGPNLWNIVNHKKATRDGYVYSKALIAVGGIWDEENLFHFLHKPSKFVPGTKMSFAGLSKEDDIADVVAYLKTNGNNN